MLTSLARLKPYLYPFRWMIIASSVLAIPLAAVRLGPVLLVKYVVDDLLVSRDAEKLLYFPLIVIAMYGANFVIRFGHYYLLRVVVARVNQKIKNDLFEHLLGLSADHFTAQSTGTLISRVGADPQNIDGGIACIHTLVREPLTFFFLFWRAWTLNWKLTLVTLLIFPPLGYVFSATGRNLKRYISRMNEENARLFSTLQESFTGIRVVKMFALEKYVRKKFRDKSQRFTKFLLKTAVLEEASHPMVELITAFAIAAVIYFGGRQVLMGRMTPGDLLAFFTAFALMMNPIRSLNDVNIKLNQAATACNRIFEIFDWKSQLPEAAQPVRMKDFQREIRVENISFSYPDTPQRVVLKNVDFAIPRGKIIALVGASGSGKSSMVNLLTRIFDVTNGRILFDGVDLRQLDRTQLRKMVAVVSQDVFLFNDTIEENIRCGRLSATHEEIVQAAERAHAMEFIRTMPDGLQSVIGDRGQKLSGGERQRISIARAFLRQAPLLILDEATSSLDTQAEKIVQSALDDLMNGRTTLVIAHRLSTIKNADEILVLKEGEILERGRHEDLLSLDGEYSRFHQMGLQ